MTLTTPGQNAPNGGRDGRQPPWRWAPERAAHDRNGDGWWMWWMCFPPSRPLLRQVKTGGGWWMWWMCFPPATAVACRNRGRWMWWMWWMCFPPSRPLLRQMRTGGGCRRTRTSTTDNILRLNTLRGGKRLVVDVQDLGPERRSDGGRAVQRVRLNFFWREGERHPPHPPSALRTWDF